MLTFTLTLMVLLAAVLGTSIRIAQEDERFAIFAMGRFLGFRGPGLVFVLPGSMKATRMSLRAEGQVQSAELVSIGGTAVPFVAPKHLSPGTAVRVAGFEPSALRVEAIGSYVICQKCGHKNAV